MPPTTPSKGLQIEISIFYDFMRTIDSFEDYVEPIDEAIFSFQFFFARESTSLMSCENYLPSRQHKGVWVTQI